MLVLVETPLEVVAEELLRPLLRSLEGSLPRDSEEIDLVEIVVGDRIDDG